MKNEKSIAPTMNVGVNKNVKFYYNKRGFSLE
jgi:hypothetical protein